MRLLIIGLVWMGGAVLGWDTAAATHKTHPATSHSKEMASFSLPQTSTLVIVPVPSLISSEAQRAQELARLETRNRRLEALVKALRKRQMERQP